MAALQWNAEWNTGIAAIDEQHRHIVYYINELEAVSEGGDPLAVRRVIEGQARRAIAREIPRIRELHRDRHHRSQAARRRCEISSQDRPVQAWHMNSADGAFRMGCYLVACCGILE